MNLFNNRSLLGLEATKPDVKLELTLNFLHFCFIFLLKWLFNKKSIKMIVRLRWLEFESLFAVSYRFERNIFFEAKSNAQFVRELSFYYDYIERYSFSYLWQKEYYRFEVDKRGSNLSISNGRFGMLISKWESSYHLEKKIRLSFQNDKIIISKWQLSPSFQNDSFA